MFVIGFDLTFILIHDFDERKHYQSWYNTTGNAPSANDIPTVGSLLQYADRPLVLWTLDGTVTLRQWLPRQFR